MMYLLAKILICLLLAALLGFIFGWLLNRIRMKTVFAQSKAKLKGQIEQMERSRNELQSELQQSEQSLTQLDNDFENLRSSHENTLEELMRSSNLAEQLQVSLSNERKRVTLVSGELEQLRQDNTNLLDSDSRLRATNDDLNTYLEAANAQKAEYKDENYRLEKALNEASVVAGKNKETIANLEAADTRNLEKISALETDKKNLQNTNQTQDEELLSLRAKLDELGNEKQLLEQKETELIETNEHLEKALQSQKEENQVQLDLVAKERDEVQVNFEGMTEKHDFLLTEINEVKKMLVDKEKDVKHQQADFDRKQQALTSENATLESKIKSALDDKKQTEERCREIETKIKAMKDQDSDRERVLEQTRQRLKQVELSEQELEDKIMVLEEGRDQKLKQLQDQLDSEKSDNKRLDLDNKQLSSLIDQSAQKLLSTEQAFHQSESDLQKEAQSLRVEITDADEALERLRDENSRLGRLLEECEGKASQASTESSNADSASANEEGSTASSDAGRPVALAAPSAPDDLKRISGIGPKIEGILYELGIYHFSQIAKFNQQNIDWVNGYLRFKGRIEREKWVSQAKILAHGGDTNFSQRYDSGSKESGHRKKK